MYSNELVKLSQVVADTFEAAGADVSQLQAKVESMKDQINMRQSKCTHLLVAYICWSSLKLMQSLGIMWITSIYTSNSDEF